MTFIPNIKDFQTPVVVANHMASMVDPNAVSIIEPTPGAGNLVAAIKNKGWSHVNEPAGDFWISYDKIKSIGVRYDYAVMNPPFTPMVEGYRYLSAAMEFSDNIIALLPWFILINSERRQKAIRDYGLVSVTHLPRKTFPGCRIQCCILEMKKGYQDATAFKNFTF